MKKAIALTIALIFLLCFSGCTNTVAKLPPPAPDENNPFGIDKNINMSTIDNYLNREDVVYRDVRMLFDPADYGAIGGEATLSRTIQGFTVVPFPYTATLQALPVSGAYEGKCLYTIIWGETGTISSATPNYLESEMIVAELFPKDKAIFLMCGGGGYAGMMKELLIFLGWNADLLYNVGANWEYNGKNRLELVIYPEEANEDLIFATWRVPYPMIDFERLNKNP